MGDVTRVWVPRDRRVKRISTARLGAINENSVTGEFPVYATVGVGAEWPTETFHGLR